jgi:hypothetical protein
MTRQLTVGIATILVLMIVGVWTSHAEAAVRCPDGSQYVCKRNGQCFCRTYQRYSTPYAYRRPFVVRPFIGLPYWGRPYVGRGYVRRGYVGRPVARGYVRRGLWR